MSNPPSHAFESDIGLPPKLTLNGPTFSFIPFYSRSTFESHLLIFEKRILVNIILTLNPSRPDWSGAEPGVWADSSSEVSYPHFRRSPPPSEAPPPRKAPSLFPQSNIHSAALKTCRELNRTQSRQAAVSGKGGNNSLDLKRQKWLIVED